MDRQEFMGKVYETVYRFELHWNKMQNTHGIEDWPNAMDESEWWEQFYAWLDTNSGT